MCVEGIVSKCGLIHPKVVKSVHYCPDTGLSLESTYRDATSIDGLPTQGLYPKEVSFPSLSDRLPRLTPQQRARPS